MDRVPKILVVDDDDAVRGFLTELLTEEAFSVVDVNNGDEALSLLPVHAFDLALLDIEMPGTGGMTVLKALRQHSPDTMVIMLTAHASLDTAVEALRQGAYDYLYKPCKGTEIRSRIHAALAERQQKMGQIAVLQQLHDLSRKLPVILPNNHEQNADSDSTHIRANRHPPRVVRWGDLVLDIRQHIITLDGYHLELSPTEFDLLAYIATEAPRVLTPKELVQKVQGYESDALEARDIVRSHIYNVRQKIRAATGREDLIRTVRGVGYTINS